MLRLTRKLDDGFLKIRDRKKEKEGGHSDVIITLGPKHSPKQKYVDELDKKGKKTGQKVSARTEEGLPLWEKQGMAFAANDEDYCLKNHGGILEKC